MEIVVETLEGPSVEQSPVEMVERKGGGHPDTLCDRAAEALSVALCRQYLARTGRVQHHNVDKAVLCAGAAEVRYGSGHVRSPLRMIHVGRATPLADLSTQEVHALAVASTREVFACALRNLDVAHELEIDSFIRPTSRDLAELFNETTAVPLANDSSIGCGYAPLSATERVVLAVASYLEDGATLDAHPYLGEDVKVLAVRTHEQIEVTVAAALVARHVNSEAEYLEFKHVLADELRQRGASITDRVRGVAVNTADHPAAGRVYLTATGTSAEAGDDGQVGRGNRTNGLITPFRPMNLEAAAGKNPVSHVGKLYNVWAQRTAALLVERTGADEAVCQLASQIGAPITEPEVVFVGLRGPAAKDVLAVNRLIHEQLETLPRLWREIIDSHCPLF